MPRMRQITNHQDRNCEIHPINGPEILEKTDFRSGFTGEGILEEKLFSNILNFDPVIVGLFSVWRIPSIGVHF